MKPRYIYFSKRVLLLLVSIAPLLSWGQQDPLFSQYMFNEDFYNPATVGFDQTTYASAAHRSQWAGYSSSFDGNGGAPSTQMINFVMPLPKTFSGVGVSLVRDKLGLATNFEARVSISYKKELRNGSISFGLRPSLFSHSLDFDRFRPVDLEDPKLEGSGRESQVRPDIGGGIFFNGSKFFTGISINHLLNPGFNFGIDNLNNTLEPSMVLYSGYNYQYNNNIIFTPSVFVRSEFNTLSFDVGVLATYKESMWGGLSYRQQEAMILILGYSFLEDKSLRVVYSFDLVVKAQEAKQPTSHEISIRKTLAFAAPGPPKIIRTPRFRFD